jgi:hypothetical protein
MYVLGRAARNALGFTGLFFLVACGGGGSAMYTAMPPTTSGLTAQDVADAQAAKLTASLDPSTKVATLTWSDTFPPGTHYAIEQLSAPATWTQIDSVPGLAGGGASLSWTRTTNVTTTFRVAAMQSGDQVPLDTMSGATSVQVTVPTTVPTIVLDQAQPVSGTVNASIANGGAYSSVSYYLDLTLVGTSSTAPAYSVAVNTVAITAGAHQLIARLATGPDSYIELRLTFQVAADQFVLSAGLPVPPYAPAPVILVYASSQYGITSVSVSLDGHSLGTLTAPNCILAGTICNPYTYQFAFDPIATGSGPHTVQVTATDGNGVTATKTVTITVSNAPSLTVSTPIDGALVNGTLPIQGTFATDKQGATVSLSVTLGDLPVLSTNQSPFSASFSLAGVTPGSYTLTATATDSTGQPTVVSRQVTITSSASLVYTPIATLGAGAIIMAVGGSHVMYMDASRTTFHLLNGSTDTALPLPPITSAQTANLLDWSVTSDGIVFADDDSSVYMWPPGGAPQNLSTAANSTGTDVLVQVHYPWLLWSSSHPTQSGGVGSDELILYNVTSGQQFDVHAPSGVTFGCYRCDFATVNGKLALFYWTDSPTLNVFRWDEASNSSVALTSDGKSLYPQTDGARVAWQTEQGQGITGPQTLSAQDLASGTVSVLSANMAAFSLADGLLGWEEFTIVNDPSPVLTAEAIRASDGMTTTTVSNVVSSAFFGSSGGYVVFEEGGKLYAWSSSGGRRLLFDSNPGQVNLTGKTVYFTNGNTQTLFAVTLP